MTTKKAAEALVATTDRRAVEDAMATWVERAAAAGGVRLEPGEAKEIADAGAPRAAQVIGYEVVRLARIRGTDGAAAPVAIAPVESVPSPSRAITEDRYDRMLVVRSRDEAPFTDSDIGDVNRRWIKLVRVVGQLIEGTAGEDADNHGDILEAALDNLRETIVAGVAGETAR